MFKTKNCPYCGNLVRDEAVFCLDCGSRINGGKAAGEKTIAEEDSTDKIEVVTSKEPAPLVDLLSDFSELDSESPACFKVVEGIDKGLEIPLEKTIYIGRLKRENSVALGDPFISREHLVINQAEGKYILENLSKTNGTLINGKQTDKHILADGDTVEIGYTVMTFNLKTD